MSLFRRAMRPLQELEQVKPGTPVRLYLGLGYKLTPAFTDMIFTGKHHHPKPHFGTGWKFGVGNLVFRSWDRVYQSKQCCLLVAPRADGIGYGPMCYEYEIRVFKRRLWSQWDSEYGPARILGFDLLTEDMVS